MAPQGWLVEPFDQHDGGRFGCYPFPTMAREKDPLGQSDEHNSRGIELADRGWLDEAVKEFKKAIELDPNSAHAHDNLATVYAEKKQFRDALEEYLTAIKLEPESATAHYNLAVFLSTHGNEFAIAQYQEAIGLEPDYPDAHLNLGLAHADDGRLEDAMKELRVAIELDPGDPFPRHELAAILMDEGDYRGAISHLKEVTRLDGKNFEAWLDLGICYAQKGFYAEAERAYDKAAEFKADDVLLAYNQAALYALWSRPADAIAHLTRAVTADKVKVQSWLRTDAMFDSLKGNADFEALR
jgi:Flp pilus assembly protein TadD